MFKQRFSDVAFYLVMGLLITNLVLLNIAGILLIRSYIASERQLTQSQKRLHTDAEKAAKHAQELGNKLDEL